MLQTPAIKADASAAASSVKDKDLASTALQTDFSNYFSQMMAAQAAPDPGTQGSSVGQDPGVLSAPPPRRPAESARKPVQVQDRPGQGPAPAGADAASQAPAQAQAQAQAASSPAPAQPPPQASGADGQGSGSKLPVGLASAAAGGAVLAAAGSAAKPTGGTDPAPAADPGPAPAASGPAPAPAASGATDSARGALDQAYPGGKFQVQYDQDATAATTKPPLSEFLNQIQMEPRPSIGAQAVDPAAVPMPATALPSLGPDPVSGLQALQAPQMAAQTALLAMPATETSGAVGATSAVAAGNAATAATAAAALALGAGAMAGASGAVRVTATKAPAEANPLPTPQQSLLEQVDGTIRYLVKNQDQSAELQLHPESLGRIQVKLKVDGNVVHAKLWASEAAAVPIMQEHRSFLESSLKAQGMTLGSFDLQHGRREDQTPLPATQAPPLEPAPGLDPLQTGQDSPSLAPASNLTSGIEYVA
jgi:flagellar hook-length control protein FliK